MGRLEVVCGSMFSGKTEELMRRLRRAEYAKQRVLTINHRIDVRYNQGQSRIVSHEGRARSAFFLDDSPERLHEMLELVKNGMDIIGIDEIHFFGPRVAEAIAVLIQSGKRVIVAGLDLDFRGEPFGILPPLMALADEVCKLKAICVKCGNDAHHTQRLINGQPAAYTDPIILVGAAELYEARCRNCFQIRRPDGDASGFAMNLPQKTFEQAV